MKYTLIDTLRRLVQTTANRPEVKPARAQAKHQKTRPDPVRHNHQIKRHM